MMISINFEFESKYGTFTDALVLPDDHNFSDDELEIMKQQRFDSWITFIETLTPEVTVEE